MASRLYREIIIMALFQRRRRRKDEANAPLGLCVPAQAVNNEELMILHDMGRTKDGLLADFVAFEEKNGKLTNELLPRAGSKRETELQLFMRLAGLTEIPTLDQVTKIQRAADMRLKNKYGPLCEAARQKGPDPK
jgi:hypothetical protein